MRPQRYRTHYFGATGVLMILAENFVTLVRMSDGYCKRFSYEQLGISKDAQ